MCRRPIIFKKVAIRGWVNILFHVGGVIEPMEEMHAICSKHLHRYVFVQLKDGSTYDGIVIDVDVEHVHLAVPLSNVEPLELRAVSGYPFHGGIGYGHPGFGYPGYPRRFYPLALPLAALAGITLLPYFW